MVVRRKSKKVGKRRAQLKKTGRNNFPKGEFVSKKMKIALISLIFSLIVFSGSWIGYQYFLLTSEFFGNFCFILAYLSGFLALAFFIALITFMILRAFKKN
jgi:hypothetical protein